MSSCNQLRIVSYFVCVIGLMASPLAAEKADDLLITGLEKKAATVKTYRADLTLEMEMMGKKMAFTGKQYYKQPNMTRVETMIDMGKIKMQQVQISDGQTSWQHQPLMNMVIKIDLKKLAEATGKKDGPAQPGTNIANPFSCMMRGSAAYLGTEQLNDEKVHVFEGKPDGGQMSEMPMLPKKTKIWVADKDGLTRKFSMINDEGAQMMAMTFSHIEINVELPDTLFKFTPAKDTQVMDMTQGTINMINQMKEKTDTNKDAKEL